jgi:hypothetical protein
MNNAALLAFLNTFFEILNRSPSLPETRSRIRWPAPAPPSTFRTASYTDTKEDSDGKRGTPPPPNGGNENPDGIFRRDFRRCVFWFSSRFVFCFCFRNWDRPSTSETDMDGTNRGRVGVDDTTPSRCPTSETNCWSWATVSMVYRYLWYLFGKA